MKTSLGSIVGLAQLVCLLFAFVSGCDEEVETKPVSFVSADPVSGSTIQPNQLITVTFDGSPAFVNVSEGTTTLTDNTLTIAGPFKQEELSLVLEWDDGVLSLTYAVEIPPVKPPVDADSPAASIQDIWVDYNVQQNGQKGMRIHVEFVVSNLKNSQCNISIYFDCYMCFNGLGFEADDLLSSWNPLVDKNGKYATPAGIVAIDENFIPDSNQKTYSDFEFFMPYSEFHAAAQALPIRTFRFVVRIRDLGQDRLLDTSEGVKFRYTQPGLEDFGREEGARALQ